MAGPMTAKSANGQDATQRQDKHGAPRTTSEASTATDSTGSGTPYQSPSSSCEEAHIQHTQTQHTQNEKTHAQTHTTHTPTAAATHQHAHAHTCAEKRGAVRPPPTTRLVPTPFLPRKEPPHRASCFKERYTLGRELGCGGSARVYECTDKVTGVKYALKAVDRAKLSPRMIEWLKEEVEILSGLRHPNIVCLVDYYETHTHHFLVIELCDGGDLLDRIVARETYTEKEARDLIKLLFSALDLLHGNAIVHRDIKPENLLLVCNSDDTYIKLADFGFSRRLIGANSLVTPCGSPDYMAPEILERRAYGEQVDCWSAGVIAFILLGGYHPFHAQIPVPYGHRLYYQHMFAKIRVADYDFDEKAWESVSDGAKDLISKLLVTNPEQRLTARQVLEHPWMARPANCLKQHDLTQGTLGNLKQKVFGKGEAKRKFIAAADVVMAINYLKRTCSPPTATRTTAPTTTTTSVMPTQDPSTARATTDAPPPPIRPSHPSVHPIASLKDLPPPPLRPSCPSIHPDFHISHADVLAAAIVHMQHDTAAADNTSPHASARQDTHSDSCPATLGEGGCGREGGWGGS